MFIVVLFLTSFLSGSRFGSPSPRPKGSTVRFTEESLDSEKVATANALVAQRDGRHYCGNCGNKVNSPEPRTCEHEGCQTVWSHVFTSLFLTPEAVARALAKQFPHLTFAGFAIRHDDGQFQILREYEPAAA